MSRLEDLKRQRASVAQHLGWLDREIADEAARAGIAPEPPTAMTPLESIPAADTPPTAVSDGEAPVPDIPEEHAVESMQRVHDARRGCFVLFGVFLGAIVLGTLLLYLLRYRH